MQATPYVFYKGNAREALQTYAEIFASEPPELFLYGAMSEADKAHMPDVPEDAVMHGAVKIGESWIYGSDDLTGEFIPMAGSSISITLADAAEAERVFAALSKGGEIRMAMSEMFFSPAFGTLTDRFGIRWMVMAEGQQG